MFVSSSRNASTSRSRAGRSCPPKRRRASATHARRASPPSRVRRKKSAAGSKPRRVLAACGKSGPDRKQQCTTAARRCHRALTTSANARRRIARAGGASIRRCAKQSARAVAPRFEAILANHCIDDNWPAANIDCYRKATSFDAMRACRDGLPAAAKTKLQTDELNLVGGAMASSPPGLASRAGSANHRAHP